MAISINNTHGCGTIVRDTNCQGDKQLTRVINGTIIKATDPQFDYSAGQPEYQGNGRCDPARDGAIDPPCCKG